MSTDDRSRARSGPIDLVSLIAGVIAAVICAAFALGDLDSFATQARVVWPTVLLGLGVGLLASGRSG